MNIVIVFVNEINTLEAAEIVESLSHIKTVFPSEFQDKNDGPLDFVFYVVAGIHFFTLLQIY